MRIRHPGRWILALFVLFAASAWLIQRAFDTASITRTIWLTYVVSSLASLFMVSQRREARPGVVSIVATLVAAVVGAWLLEVVEVRWWVRWILLGVIGMPLMSIANAAFRADIRRAQRRRESRAAALVQAVVAGQRVEPYTLYLRPFVSTDRLMAQALPSDIGPPEQVPVHLDVETVLARSLHNTAPLIALGHSLELDEGAARVVTTDDRWRATVLALARGAELVVMLPLSRPSTTWELRQIVESGLLGKTLFLMPEIPHETPNGVWATTESADRVFEAGIRSFNAQAHMLDLEREWRDATDAARALNVELPPMAAVGALFTIDTNTGKAKEILPLGLSTLVRPIRYLHWSFARLGLKPSTDEAPPDLDAAFAMAVFLGGRTLEFALMRAADGMALWGNTAAALRLLAQAFDEGKPEAPFVRGYVEAIPGLLQERMDKGDTLAARRYADFGDALRQDRQLGPLVRVGAPTSTENK